jgi:hypothetical protein
MGWKQLNDVSRINLFVQMCARAVHSLLYLRMVRT